MASIKFEIPYVEEHWKTGKRGVGYRYRRVVPLDVREKIGRKNWVVTFKPNTAPLAIEREARQLAARHDRLIERARNGDVVDADAIEKAEATAKEWLAGDKARMHEMMFWLADQTATGGELPATVAAMVNAIENGGRYVPVAMKLSAAYDRDKKLYGGSRYEKSVTYAVESFIAAIGDKDVTAITRQDVIDWIGGLRSDGNAPATIRRRVGALRAVVNRVFLDLDVSQRNPFEKHKIAGSEGGADDRLPFNKKMLKRIDDYLESGRPRHDTVNLVRLLRCTGAGPAEIGGLTLDDVSLDTDIPYVWIRGNKLRGLKTKVRERRIPLVGDALQAAKDAYQRARVKTKGKSAEDIPLFKSFGAGDRGADFISAKINSAIRAASVPKSPRLTAYSFRHTVKEALRSAEIVDHVQRRLLGHAGQGVADRYGSPAARLSEAQEALQAAMQHLGDVDDTIYSKREKV